MDDKKKSEARLRYEKVQAAKVKKHVKELDREVEILRRQFGPSWKMENVNNDLKV